MKAPSKLKQAFKDKKALTMIEMVAAIGVLFISSTFCLEMFIAGARMPDRGEKNIKIADTAQIHLQKLTNTVDLALYQRGIDPTNPNNIAALVGGPPTTVTDGDYTVVSRIDPISTTAPDTTLPTNCFARLSVDVTDTQGRHVTLQTMRRIRARPLPGTLPADVVAGQEILQMKCISCHTDASRAPIWTAATITANAAASGMTLDAYVDARITGSAGPLPIPPYGTMSPQFAVGDTEVQQVREAIKWELTH